MAQKKTKALGKRRTSLPGVEPNPEEIGSWRPVAFVDDPDREVPHDQIPAELKASIVDTYGEPYFLSRSWTFGTLKRLSTAIRYPRENLTHSIVQICGPRCPTIDVCPYAIVGRTPAGERCPIELKTSEHLYNEYVKAVAERLAKEEKEIKLDIILHNLINGLVEADIVEMRLNSLVASEGFTIETVTVINEETGEVYTRQEEAISLRIKERVNARRSVLYRQLLATPEMAEKYKRSADGDIVAKTAELLAEVEKTLKGLTVSTPTKLPLPADKV